MDAKAKTVAAYIAHLPPAARRELKRVRGAILKAAPGVREKISYQVPYYSLERFMCALNAYGPKRDKLSFIVTPGTVKAFRKELKALDVSGGSIHFSADNPIPAALLGKLIRERVRVASR